MTVRALASGRPVGLHVAIVVVGAVALASTALGASQVQAQSKRIVAKTVTVKAEGPLADITSNPLNLAPTFSPTITDYVLHCQAGTNTTQFSLAAATGGAINVRGNVGAKVSIQESLVENEAMIISVHGPGNPGGTDYWIRCLPHDFPQLGVTKPGNPPSGWYLTGNILSPTGNPTYAMVLDNNGTPVWYRQSSGHNVLNVTLLADGTIAWATSAGPGFGVSPNAAFEDYDLVTGTTRFLKAPITPTDFHELEQMANGDLMMLGTPLRAGVDLTSLGLSHTATIVDCVLQEVDPNGNLVWLWRASDHISVTESTHPHFGTVIAGQVAYDLFHCNSIDTEPISGNIVLSIRHTDAVYLIGRATGAIIWKMGGNSASHDGERFLAVKGDPDGLFNSQHDVRFLPNDAISMYDNQSMNPGHAARGAVYRIDAGAGTATLVWSFQSPDGRNSAATGSFRTLNSGTDNVIAWGAKPGTLFTELDALGDILLNVTYPNGELAYRVVKVSSGAISHSLLRATAGLPPFVLT